MHILDDLTSRAVILSGKNFDSPLISLWRNEVRRFLKNDCGNEYLEIFDNLFADISFVSDIYDEDGPQYRHEKRMQKVTELLYGIKEEKKSGKEGDLYNQTLSHLHCEVRSKCASLYDKKEYSEAVGKSFRVVKDRLRELTSFEKASEAFGKGNLRIQGASSQNTEKDFNKGVQYLTMAIDMFRNEKSHTADAKIEDSKRAYEYLSLSSLAMNLLDAAYVSKKE